jgi:hypothetical protein
LLPDNGDRPEDKVVMHNRCVRISTVAVLILVCDGAGRAETPRPTPSPNGPQVSWEQIASYAEFKALPVEKRLIMLKNYAKELSDYLKSLPGMPLMPRLTG